MSYTLIPTAGKKSPIPDSRLKIEDDAETEHLLFVHVELAPIPPSAPQKEIKLREEIIIITKSLS